MSSKRFFGASVAAAALGAMGVFLVPVTTSTAQPCEALGAGTADAELCKQQEAVRGAIAGSLPVHGPDFQAALPQPAPAAPQQPAPAAPSNIATVTGDVDIYDVPGGVGNVIGMLEGGEGQQVQANCRDDN